MDLGQSRRQTSRPTTGRKPILRPATGRNVAYQWDEDSISVNRISDEEPQASLTKSKPAKEGKASTAHRTKAVTNEEEGEDLSEAELSDILGSCSDLDVSDLGSEEEDELLRTVPAITAKVLLAKCFRRVLAGLQTFQLSWKQALRVSLSEYDTWC